MEKIQINVINKSNNPLPQFMSEGAAGADLCAFIKEPTIILPGERKLIPTGIYMALPEGYEAQIRPRSGLALNHGITVLNAPGTIDSDYRGEIGVCLINLSNDPYEIKDGERIAQMVLAKYEQANFEIVDELDETERGQGGWGHTGSTENTSEETPENTSEETPEQPKENPEV